MELDEFVAQFAEGLRRADTKRPKWKGYSPGIGPHEEDDVVRLVIAALSDAGTAVARHMHTQIRYPNTGDQRSCDICVGSSPDWEWAIEVKAFRMLRDNGTVEPNAVKQVLSPYAQDRSAIGDLTKLGDFRSAQRRAFLAFGYDYQPYPLDALVAAFEAVASLHATLAPRQEEAFEELVHPHHRRGRVMAWEVVSRLAESR